MFTSQIFVSIRLSLFDTSCPTVCEPYQPPPEGFTLWSTSSGVATPTVGDICIVRLLQYQPEDICVLKLLADGTFQWYSNPRSSPQVNRQVRNTQSFDLFKQTYFLPGWELDATRTAEVEYRELKPDETQIPFVANHADIIPFVFLWGSFKTTTTLIAQRSHGSSKSVRDKMKPPGRFNLRISPTSLAGALDDKTIRACYAPPLKSAQNSNKNNSINVDCNARRKVLH
jgi:hypothetical protein